MNIEFVSKFIEECAMIGAATPEEICAEARRRIAEIDEKVKYRIQLSDVFETFKEPEKLKLNEVRLSNEPNRIDEKLARDVIELIGGRSVQIHGLAKFFDKFSDEYKRNLIYTTKCMIEDHILCRNQDDTICIVK
jgi:hypothetical protein